MWVEIVCGLIVYKMFRRLFYGDDPAVPDVDSRDSDISFAVAARLERIYGGKAYVGLRIPDPETSSRQHIEIVLVTKREVMVVVARSFSGFVEAGKDGSWVCTRDKKHKPEIFPDPVLASTRQAAVLESYLEQRGVPLPKGHLIGRVVLPNPNCRAAHSIDFQQEVISYDKWIDLKSESRSGFSSWVKDVKDAFHGSKSETQDGFHQRLHFVLSTAPMWDRLELSGDRSILGEFLEFKGNQEDVQTLKLVKRSKVSRLIIQKSTMFNILGRSRDHIFYSPRDYRSEGASASEWKEVAVKPSTEVVFHPLNSKKARKFKLSSIVSLSLSA